MSLRELIEGWDGLATVASYDRPTATWIFIALHDATLGRPTGGSRMKVYDAPEEGLLDAMRLAEGMTHKWAAIDFDCGGGKGVLALSRPLEDDERRALLSRYGRLIDSLNGSFATGEDLGTTPQDMAVIAEETDYVMGGHAPDADGSPTDPGPFTARGVFVSMRSAVCHAFGDGSLAGKRVLIQGLGDVGLPLARLLAGAGAHLLLSDIDLQRVAALAQELGAETVAVEALYDTPCDVYAPCAVGATLNRDTIPRLRSKVVAGSANNQLAETADADRLHERGILYAPDYVCNAGGALAFGWIARGVSDPDTLFRHVEGLERSMEEILSEAAERNESPHHAAHRRVERVLAAGRQRQRRREQAS